MPNQKMINKPDERECYLCGAKYRKSIYIEMGSAYDYPYIDRRFNRNEITMLYNDSIIRHGGIYHYKQMYPDFFTWLKKRWGDIIFN